MSVPVEYGQDWPEPELYDRDGLPLPVEPAEPEEETQPRGPLLGRASRTVGVEARVAEIVKDRALRNRFRFVPGLGWLEWRDGRWDDDQAAVERAHDAVRAYVDRQERLAKDRVNDLAERAMALKTRVVGRAAVEQLEDDKGQMRDPDDVFAELATDAEKTRLAELVEQHGLEQQQAGLWLSMLSHQRILALVTLARRMDGVLTRVEELDNHPDLLNVHNGVVDLRTGELTPHDPDLLITKMAGGDYDPDAAHELWEQALAAVPEDIHEWFQTRMGQSFTGHTPDDDAMIVTQGTGENGKSAVMLAALRALGSYGRTISHKVMMSSPGQHTTELTTLRGLRFALMEETPEEGHLDTHQLKITIGTPEITARRIRENDITFQTSHTLWINTNFLPTVDTTDHGTWRRLKAVEFPYRFLKPGIEPAEEHEIPGDPSLKPRLATDPKVVTAVISWAVAGAVRWYAAGRIAPEDPERVKLATIAWRQGSDVAYLFASEELIQDPQAFISAGDMLSAFNRYVEQQGKRPWSASLMGKRLPASLEAGKLGSGHTVKLIKVRAGDKQSRPAEVDPFDRATKDYVQGDALKGWRGLRFKTDAERRAGAAWQITAP